jgi:hypothetical protein
MLRQAGGLAIGEGCAVDTSMNAHITIVGAVNALNLLTDTKFVKATLRF